MTDAERDPLDAFLDGMAEEAGAGTGEHWAAFIEMDGTITIGDEEISRAELDRRLEDAPNDGEIRVIDFRTDEQRERDRRKAEEEDTEDPDRDAE